MRAATDPGSIRAVPPSVAYRESFLEAIDGYEAAGERERFEMYAPARDDFGAFVENLLGQERGLYLREGWVPCSHRWLVSPGRDVVGVVRIRHELTTALTQAGGHIGYDVPPRWRRRGFGRLCLAFGLERCRELNIDRALVTCDPTNVGSRKIIEGGGGVVGNEGSNSEGRPTLRYWVAVG